MKTKFRVAAIVLITILLSLVTCVGVFAEDATDEKTTYIVENSGEEYLAKSSATERFETLSELISTLEADGVTFSFSEVSADDGITLSKNVNMTGELHLSYGNVTVLSGSVWSDFFLTLDNGSVKVKSGVLRAESGKIYSGASSAFVLDYSSEARLCLLGADVEGVTSEGAVRCGIGAVEISGGSVKNGHGVAIENSATLMLGGAPDIQGFDCAVRTSRPIHLCAEGLPLESEVSVTYQSTFDKGSFTAVFLDAQKSILSNIRLFDIYGESYELSYFDTTKYYDEKSVIAVYLPYRVKFYVDNNLYKTVEYIKNEIVTAPASPDREGYAFCGWYSDASKSESYAFGSPITDDIGLYAAFKLSTPEFSISSKNYVYNGEEKKIAFDKLSHPLMSEGAFSYEWYKDGEAIAGSAGFVTVKNVTDSGKYYCKLTFTHGGDYITVETPEIDIIIEKQVLRKPSLKNAEYTGDALIPDIPESELYEASYPEIINAGTYNIALSLYDSENYKWSDSDTGSTSVEFTVLRAENAFLRTPSVETGYEGIGPRVSVSVKFGKPEYYYSSDKINWIAGIPLEVGSYYLRVSVDECDNFSAISSDAMPFTIIEETVIGIKTDTPPTKREYIAFEAVELSGATFTVTYNSGRSEILDNSLITLEYRTGKSLRVGDTCVSAVFDGVSTPIFVSVKAREYDLSAITFNSKVAVYNATRHTIKAEGEVIGLDGIKLTYKVTGGGIDVGTYTVTLSFNTESPNYKVPDSITKSLTVTPMPLSVEYTDTEFTYDGFPKVPTATVSNATGLTIKLQVMGGAVNAGEYKANAIIDDKNYVLENPDVEFRINKALLDLTVATWSENSFLYNGKEQGVSASGLPAGVTVIGYANASFTDAGKYRAVASLSYDDKNYLPPEELFCDWEIVPADYEFKNFAFVDTEVIYNGEVHYPEFVGTLPTGVDGSRPSYTFSGGATHVSDGKVLVTVTFASDSKNYNTPAPVSAFVSVVPKSVKVTWGSVSFIYNGEYQLPTATNSECLIKVTGSGVDAGEYIAVAKSENPDYTVTNSKISFKISKAENSWIKAPGILNCYTSAAPSPFGEAMSGDIEFLYYKDMECKTPASYPFSSGDYYMVALVPEGKNYLSVSSETIKFSVIEVVPVKLEVRLLSDSFVAKGGIFAKDVTAYYVNNDGTQTLIPFKDITVKYGNGNTLSFSDNSVTFEVGGFSYSAPITVIRASYDMSATHWENEHHVYDGSEKSAYLIGLPEGVTLVEYRLNSAVSAGSYKLSAVLDYDTENYYPPSVPDAWLVIDKSVVCLPQISDLEYDKTYKSAYVPNNDIYTASIGGGVAAGEYKVVFTLNDPENYEFENGISEKNYKILPRPVKVEIGENGKSFTVISGGILSGDSLLEEYYTEDGWVYLSSGNPNYLVTVVPRESKGAENHLPLILLLVLLILLLSFGVYIFFNRREAVTEIVSKVKGRFVKIKSPSPTNGEKQPKLDTLLVVDESHANSMLTDSIARSLVSETKTVIETAGTRRVIVNLDTICESFNATDTVDINSMKEKGIIPHDALRVKVLARGFIDKPLTVVANSFSISAVKMIALTGGKAVRARTARKK